MIDRIISGAGGVSAAVDRFVRSLAPGGSLAHQPASILVAAVLAVLALVLVAVGLESTVSGTPRPLDPETVAGADDLGGRVNATMVGRLPGTYVESFADDDLDGVQDPEETGEAWDYFLLGLSSDDGVMVRSRRPPSDVYAYAVSGTVVEDPTYVQADLEYVTSEFSIPGLILDPTKYIVATGIDSGVAHDLAEDLPAADTEVALRASRAIEYLTVCSADPDGDGICSEAEVDLYDVFVYDPVSRRAVVVVTEVSPAYQPASFSGILRKDARAVAEATGPNGTDLDELGIRLSPVYLLDDGVRPSDTRILFALAVLGLAVAGVIAVGVVGGYVVFRHGGTAPAGVRSLGPGERLALHVTGVLRGPAGLVHVREAPGDLVRLVLESPPPGPTDDGTPSVPAATALVVERRDRPEGVAVGAGEARAVTSGTVVTFRERRPGLRVTAGTGRIILSFARPDERDRAAAELVAEVASVIPGATTNAEDT